MPPKAPAKGDKGEQACCTESVVRAPATTKTQSCLQRMVISRRRLLSSNPHSPYVSRRPVIAALPRGAPSQAVPKQDFLIKSAEYASYAQLELQPLIADRAWTRAQLLFLLGSFILRPILNGIVGRASRFVGRAVFANVLVSIRVLVVSETRIAVSFPVSDMDDAECAEEPQTARVRSRCRASSPATVSSTLKTQPTLKTR